ncbi:hypothetical protein NDU88_005427 [Pleurodeles waltl]|uniref:Uncharacterized protein n=1 Tax=Pleurodeles waltl TaxID=8319 RepID=A0AAV7SLM4_PLEWA|nr:hypothetical protein NDU88_005427 [Pleurodeles waltl]
MGPGTVSEHPLQWAQAEPRQCPKGPLLRTEVSRRPPSRRDSQPAAAVLQCPPGPSGLHTTSRPPSMLQARLGPPDTGHAVPSPSRRVTVITVSPPPAASSPEHHRRGENPSPESNAGRRPSPRLSASSSRRPREHCHALGKASASGPYQCVTLRAPVHNAQGVQNIEGTPGLMQEITSHLAILPGHAPPKIIYFELMGCKTTMFIWQR